MKFLQRKCFFTALSLKDFIFYFFVASACVSHAALAENRESLDSSDRVVSESPFTPSPRLTIDRQNFFGNLPVPRLDPGLEVPIYHTGGKYYYYTPSIIPDWVGYGAAVKAACPQEVVTSSVDPVLIKMRLFLDERDYRRNIHAGMQLRLKSYEPASLNVIPYDMLRIHMKLNGLNKLVWPENSDHLRNLLPQFREMTRTKLDEYIDIPLKMSCVDHFETISRKADPDLFSGSLYRIDPKYNTTEIHAIIAAGLDHHLISELFSEESVAIGLRFGVDSETFSVNLPVQGSMLVQGGASDSSGGVNVDVGRIITRDVTDRLAQKTVRQAGVACFGLDCLALLQQTLPTILSTTVFDKALLERTQDGYQLRGDHFDYVTITDTEISGQIDAALKTIASREQEGGFKFTELAESEFRQSAKSESDGSGSGQISYTGPIGTIADLAVISEADIREMFTSIVSLNIPTDEDNLVRIPFIYEPWSNWIESRTHVYSLMSEQERAEQRGQCITGHFDSSNRDTGSRRSGSHVTPHLTTERKYMRADPGKYISSHRPSTTGGHNHRVEDQGATYSKIVGPFGSIVPDGSGNRGVMVDRAWATFTCHKGRRAGIRRRCTVRWQIDITQRPLFCARWTVPGYAKIFGVEEYL